VGDCVYWIKIYTGFIEGAVAVAVVVVVVRQYRSLRCGITVNFIINFLMPTTCRRPVQYRTVTVQYATTLALAATLITTVDPSGR